MYKIWYRNFLFFKKTFLVSIFWTVLEPLMFLGALGFGFGRYIPNIEGLSFLEFYYAGLLCTTVMMVSYFEATYPNYTKMTHQKTYNTMLLTPINPRQIFNGEIFWGATKGLIGLLGLFLVSSLFGLYNNKFFILLPTLFLLGLIFSAFGMIVVSIAKNYDSFVFSTSGVIVPLSVISGTYFSLQEMNSFLKTFAYLFPLAHAVNIVRSVLYRNVFSNDQLINYMVLVLYFVIFTLIGQKLFAKKLIS
ncbi:MAG: ABC transporter permease [Pseudobdellovibrio sp.]